MPSGLLPNNFFYLCLKNWLATVMPFYAVAVGHTPGIYESWGECSSQINGCKGAKFKKFPTVEEAQAFVDQFGSGTVGKSKEKTGNVAKKPRLADETDWPGYYTHFMAENLNPPNLMRVENVSPSDTQLHQVVSRLTAIESKLSLYIDRTQKTFEKLTTRIASLENLLASKTTNGTSANVEPMRIAESPDSDPPPNWEKFLWKNGKTVCVYTDGACSSNGKSNASAGIGVWFNHDHPLNVSAPVKGPPTNNNAEIQAARVAITQAASAGVKHLAIYTDSKFVINSITKWIHRWKTNGWKTANGGAVKNKVELVKLEEAIQTVDSVEWVHVRGHCGTLGNENADALARKGAELYDSKVRYADHVDGDGDDDELECDSDN